jgi:hypothetical protein
MSFPTLNPVSFSAIVSAAPESLPAASSVAHFSIGSRLPLRKALPAWCALSDLIEDCCHFDCQEDDTLQNRGSRFARGKTMNQ